MRRTLQAGDGVALVACSDGVPLQNKNTIEEVKQLFLAHNIRVYESPCLYDRGDGFCGSARERAQVLMDCYKNVDIHAIFDVSGGNLANGVLPYLDFAEIQNAQKPYYGYSDLTVLLNAVYAKTGVPSCLYQVRNLVYADREQQQNAFFSGSLCTFPYFFVQGEQMEGIVAGGNIRCLLKLAGTEYFPDLTGKILLLEACSGGVTALATYLEQLHQIGVWKQVNGVLLGTFTQLEREMGMEKVLELVLPFVGEKPLAKTQYIGHGMDSAAIWIGAFARFVK